MSKKPSMNTTYFIDKLKEIPNEKWAENDLFQVNNGQTACCVMGHCKSIRRDYGTSPESEKLQNMFIKYLKVEPWKVNDGLGDTRKFGKTPKERVINALKWIRINTRKPDTKKIKKQFDKLMSDAGMKSEPEKSVTQKFREDMGLEQVKNKYNN